MITRRTVAKGSLAIPLVYLQARRAWGRAMGDATRQSYLYDDDCGVASGHPSVGGFIIWTRVPAAARAGLYAPVGPNDAVPVTYEVARDADFSAASIVSRGTLNTDSTRDFTLKAKIEGLEAFTTYYYRFRVGADFISAIGRAKTLPAPGTMPERLRLGIVVCQKFSPGYYAAYGAMCGEAFDFCLHLGDHIYEKEAGRGGSGDPLSGAEAKTLADYRAKYRYYLSDPMYREARRLFTWIDLWDDHEVFNNYAGSVDRDKDPQRFSGAYRAFLEYMPIDADVTILASATPEVQLYRTHALGDLVEIFVADERQYRSPNACSSSFMTRGCDAMWDQSQTMLGTAQKTWLKESLGQSRCTWKLLANELVMAPIRVALFEESAAALAHRWQSEESRGLSGDYLNLDQWDGYPTERADLLGFIQDNRIDNVIVASGDVHAAFNGYLYRDPTATDGQAAALEIVTTSITSETLGERAGSVLHGAASYILKHSNPHLPWMNINDHGYTALEITPATMDVKHVIVDSISKPTATASVDRHVRINAGKAVFVE